MIEAQQRPAGLSRSKPRSSPMRGEDLVLTVLLCAAATLFALWQPRHLNPADESVYLYEAKRVLEGEVLYRDVFEITTPGWIYLMAALFRLFGIDLATARMAVGILHGLTSALLYATCRRLGLRPGLSLPAPLAYLLVSQTAWPIASQHWLATTLSVVVLWSCARLPAARARWTLLPGAFIGLLIGVHQQRGVFVGAGVVLWLIVDHLLQRWYRSARIEPPLFAQLALLAAGSALVVVPMAIVTLASAGVAPVWQALIVHPIFNYRSFSYAPWGHSGGLLAEQASYTFPTLLKYLPAILAVDLLRLVVLAARRQGRDEARRLALLICFGLGSIGSIAYFPDFIHIAFIAPAFFVAVAESVHWAVGDVAARSRPLRIAGCIAGGVLLAACALRLQSDLARSRAAFPIHRATAFGRVDFARPFEAELYDRVQALMAEVPSRELFCYPIISSLYLMADADNPTRFQFLHPGYNSPAQLDEVVQVLETRKLPYIVAFPGFLGPQDPILTYLQRDYEPLAGAGSGDPGEAIFRRKDRGGA